MSHPFSQRVQNLISSKTLWLIFQKNFYKKTLAKLSKNNILVLSNFLEKSLYKVNDENSSMQNLEL
jgi:hypothetical protein